ncbi:MAG: hypothetical protein EOM24_16245 [Chloroflexia bacterium]|nr:hypothetical protein [Chloroflexia bacterium]
MPYQFYRTCVGWPRQDADNLSKMVDEARDITRNTFLSHVDKEELSGIEIELGYVSHPSRGLTMANDWHVSYHRSKLHGKRVYYFRWSGIEYVFTQTGEGE